MNDDNMNKFFSDNRNEFDDKTPSERIWTRIDRVLFGGKQVVLWNALSLWRAAAIFLLGVTILQFAVTQKQKRADQDMTMQQEFFDVESFYTAQISEKVSLIYNDDFFVDDQFTQDLGKLEAMYAVLTEELRKQPSERLKDALVLNMLVRIDLLNQQIQKLEESKRKAPAEV